MKLAVIGNPIAHSKSPLIFEFLFKEMDLQATYEKILLESAQDLPELFSQDYNGFNITAPFKQSVLPYLDLLADEVRKIGSVNTVLLKEGKAYGYNTDYWGVIGALTDNNISLTDKKCLVLGAGGAARAAIYALKCKGALVEVFNRTEAKAKALAEEFNVEYCTEEDLYDILSRTEILIDTLPAGVKVLALDKLPTNLVVVDASYPKSVYSNSSIATLISGEQWLLHQALPAFKLLTGIELNKDAYNQEALLDLLIDKK